MNTPLVNRRRWLACTIAVVIATQAFAAQQSRPNPYGTNRPSASTAPTSAPATSFKPEELEQVVAGIALYPDSLVSQVLMASTYPVEVVQAERWAKENKGLKGDALAKELEKQTWDPSVKSLVNFPEVLTMMSTKLDWTVKLGDAFIAQQKDVMDTIQRLRAKAKDQGNLASNSQQNVTVQAAPATQAAGSSSTQVITIESTNPEVVYVPTYNPTVVYGGWPYPSYPPYSYYPPTYVPGQAAVAFGVGVAIGAAWGYAWGGCNWGGGDVDVDIDRNVNINSNIDREKYKAERDARQTDRQGNRTERQANRDGSRAGGASSFQHDPSHRKGVAYRDQGTAQRFGGASSAQAVQARDAYRGRAEAGRQDIARGGADSYRSGAGAPARDSRSSYGGSAGDRSTGSYNRSSQSGTRSGAFNDAGSSGRQTRSYSDRGQSSRSSSGASRSSGGGSRSAPARSGGGGGARGGGGRGGGGGRR
jgi:hypothetical protein